MNSMSFIEVSVEFIHMHIHINTSLLSALSAIVVFGLGGLSFVPHQEARFLAPLLVPLIFIFTWNRAKLSRTFWVML